MGADNKMAEKYKVLAGKWKKTGHSGLERFVAKNPGQTEGLDANDIIVWYKLKDDIECTYVVGGADPVTLHLAFDGTSEQEMGGYKFFAKTTAADGKICFAYEAEGVVLKREVMHFPTANEMVAETTSNG